MVTFDTVNEDILELCNKDWLSNKDIEKMGRIIPDCDAELHLFFAKNLINSDPEESWPLLQVLTGDPDPLVRAEACQSLGENSGKDSFDLLKRICQNDSDEMVRVYAIVSLGLILNAQAANVIQEALDILADIKEKEHTPRVQLALCEALYRVLPREEYLDEIAGYFDDRDYAIRCTALNCLCGIVTSQNKEYIRKQILHLQEMEDAQAVLSAIARLKEELEDT